MARTAAGRTLTEQHRLAQLQVRTRALRDYLALWPIWEGDEESFGQLAIASLVLVRAYHGLSASVAAGYFQSFRQAEGVDGEAVTRLAGPVDADKVVAGLHVTGRKSVAKSLTAGRTPEDARSAALTRTSGTVTRQVLTGGRETILLSVAEDKDARGWARVTDGDPCAFCALLASRGPVYKADTVDFEAHDACGCAAEPVYGKSEWPGRAREFHDLYNEAVLEADQAGELRRGTSNDLLNAFRRKLNAQ
jgi:hypothetical protein